jgi:hypothetical protein
MNVREPQTTRPLSADKVAGPTEAPAGKRPEPTPDLAPTDFTALMRRVEAEFYDAT